jgi:hypothetical protein
MEDERWQCVDMLSRLIFGSLASARVLHLMGGLGSKEKENARRPKANDTFFITTTECFTCCD